MSNPNDRRSHPRMTASYECVVSHQGRTITAVTHDVSPRDLSLYLAEPLQVRDSVDVKIAIPRETIALKVKAEVRYCIQNPNRSQPEKLYLAGLEFTRGPIEAFATDNHPGLQTRYTPSHTVRIMAPPEKCHRLIADFEAYPRWSRGVESARVLERHPDGRGKLVEFKHNFFLRRVTYVLDYAFDDPNLTLAWNSAGGDDDILAISGKYRFMPDHDDTLARYELDVTISLVPSQYIVNYVTAILMRQEMKNFMKFVEAQK